MKPFLFIISTFILLSLIFSACNPSGMDPEKMLDPEEEGVVVGEVEGWEGVTELVSEVEGQYDSANSITRFYYDSALQIIDSTQAYSVVFSLNSESKQANQSDYKYRVTFVLLTWGQLLTEKKYFTKGFNSTDEEHKSGEAYYFSVDADDFYFGEEFATSSRYEAEQDSTSYIEITNFSLDQQTVSGTFNLKLVHEHGLDELMEINGTFNDVKLIGNVF